MSEAVEPGPPAQLVLMHDGAGVAVGKPVLVGQPVRALLAAQEGRAGFEACEPLRESSSGDRRDARDQVLMRFRGVVQSQLAPPGATPASVETASRPRSWQAPKPTSSKPGGVLREPPARLAVTWSSSGGKRSVAARAAGRARTQPTGAQGCRPGGGAADPGAGLPTRGRGCPTRGRGRPTRGAGAADPGAGGGRPGGRGRPTRGAGAADPGAGWSGAHP